MAEPLKKDEALAAAVREAFQRHMEAARLAAQASKEKSAAAPSASLPPRSASPAPARDTRLAVPTPANDAPAVSETAPVAVIPVAPQPKPAQESAALSRLVAIASPQKVSETSAPKPTAIETPEPAVETIEEPVAKAAEDTHVAAAESLEAELPVISPPAADPVAEPRPQSASGDSGLDFGEALFIEIAPELDKAAPAELPKMPKAASLDTPLREPLSQSGADDLEFRQPPLRERPRMSTTSAAAAPPQDLDLLARASDAGKAAPVEPKLPVVKEDKAVDLPAPAAVGKPTTRFGVATPARPAAVNANKRGRFGSRGTFKIPAALVASVALALGIAGVGSYVWSNPQELQALSALVAPPAPAESKVAVATAAAKPPGADSKIDASLPMTQPASAPSKQVASVPTPPPSAIAPMSLPDPTPPAATRSVSTVAITLDEVDEAVQSAREMTMMGDIDGARQALDSYRNGSDPRALFALAETYDPSIVKDPSKADPAQAKTLYEAAAKAGSQDNTADRIARLALAHTN
ncbi:hypothetical protein ACMDCR_18290 [Labrys okinawensis]|uniref:hypothetical protein n=1 Tax=Labrys okinawensis TaxID=346911 RepID=UPI0039BCDA51